MSVALRSVPIETGGNSTLHIYSRTDLKIILTISLLVFKSDSPCDSLR